MTTKKLWIGFLAVMTILFAVFLFFGRNIYRQTQEQLFLLYSSSDLNLAGALRNDFMQNLKK